MTHQNHETSTVAFRSNIQIRTGHIEEDVHFFSSIHDPIALETLKRRYPSKLTALQENEWELSSQPCAISPYREDRPFGLVPSDDGPVGICRCIHTECRNFSQCRQDFTEDELECLKPHAVVSMDRTVPEVIDLWNTSKNHRLLDGQAYIDDTVLETMTPEMGTTDDVDLDAHLIDAAAFANHSQLDELGVEKRTSFTLHQPELSEDADPDEFAFTASDVLLPAEMRPDKPEQENALLPGSAESDNFWDDVDYLLWPTEALFPPITAKTHERLYERVLWPSACNNDTLSAQRANRMSRRDFLQAMLHWQEYGIFNSFENVSQSEVVSLPPEARTLVNAGPGTGKTWCLIERLIYLVETADIEPGDIQVLCYSRAAKRVVLNRLAKAANEERIGPSWRDIEINTFHSYAGYLNSFMRQNGMALPHWRKSADSYDDCIRLAVKYLTEMPELVSGVKHLIVDEIQDLVNERAELLLLLTNALPSTCGFTYLGDSCQSIYDYSSRQRRSGVSSITMYQRLIQCQPDMARLSFTENHRSSQGMLRITDPFRRAILQGTPASQDSASFSAGLSLFHWDPSWRHISSRDFSNMLESGTIGILTRSNGEALELSSILRTGSVPHNLELSQVASFLDGWVASVLISCRHQTIDYTGFATEFSKLYPSADPETYWDALTASRLVSGNRYEVRDLLSDLYTRKDIPQLYASPEKRDHKITVCTIHRAKGQEYDTVVLPSKLLKRKPGEYRQKDNAAKSTMDRLRKQHEEHQVAYVGLTRAKSAVRLATLPREMHNLMSKESDGRKRWYRMMSHARRRPQLHKLQIYSDTDFIPSSFAESDDAQAHLLSLSKDLGTLSLELRAGTHKGRSTYCLFDQDAPSTCLARVTDEFVSLVKELCKGPLPETFLDVCPARLVTFIGKGNEIPAGAHRFGEYGIWFGLELSGMAEADYQRY